MTQRTFKEISDSLNCDKTTYHLYDQFYPLFLEHKRNQNFRLMEIGVDEGRSLHLWREYFPYAKLIGVDIKEKSDLSFDEFYQVDQSNWRDLCDLAEIVKNVDVIIDDGSHIPEHQISSFEVLFPRCLTAGGIYIIEDIECSYWREGSPIYGYTTSGVSVFDYFKDVHHIINSHINRQNNNLNIQSISFFQNAIVIQKQTNDSMRRAQEPYRVNFNI